MKVEPGYTLLIGAGKLGQRYYQHLSRTQTNSNLVTLSRSEKRWSKQHIMADLSRLLSENAAQQLDAVVAKASRIVFILAPAERTEIAYQTCYIDVPTAFFQRYHSILQRNQVHISWLSSTSVYGDQQGEINERTAVQPNNLFSKILYGAEQLLQAQELNCSIIRAAGLYSSQRPRLIQSLLDDEQKNNPKWMNLIHEADVCQYLDAALTQSYRLVVASDGVPFQRKSLHTPCHDDFTERAQQSSRTIRSVYADKMALNYPNFLYWLC